MEPSIKPKHARRRSTPNYVISMKVTVKRSIAQLKRFLFAKLLLPIVLPGYGTGGGGIHATVNKVRTVSTDGTMLYIHTYYKLHSQTAHIHESSTRTPRACFRNRFVFREKGEQKLQIRYVGEPQIDVKPVVCTIKSTDETVIHQTQTITTKETTDIPLPAVIFDSGSKLHKIRCSVQVRQKPGDPLLWLD